MLDYDPLNEFFWDITDDEKGYVASFLMWLHPNCEAYCIAELNEIHKKLVLRLNSEL